MNTPPRLSHRRTLAGGLLAGGAAGLLLLAPSIVDAATPFGEVFGQTTPPTTEPASSGAEVADTDDLTLFEPGDHLRQLLQSLVDDGTLTADQLEAIVETVQSADVFARGGPMLVPPHGGQGGPFDAGRGDGPMFDREIGRGHHGGGFGDSYALDLVANTIGITAPDLLDQLGDGATVADIATAAGTDPQAVIDVLIANAQSRLDAAVQSGRITQATADERLEAMTEQVTDVVNGGDDSDDADAASDEATDTSEGPATTETTTG